MKTIKNMHTHVLREIESIELKLKKTSFYLTGEGLFENKETGDTYFALYIKSFDDPNVVTSRIVFKFRGGIFEYFDDKTIFSKDAELMFSYFCDQKEFNQFIESLEIVATERAYAAGRALKEGENA